MVTQKLSSQYEIWLAFGTGKNFRYLAAHEMASCLGQERSLALPMFHAITGCDTVSSFVGHGKKPAWTIWKPLPELTGTLVKLADSPARVTEEAMKAIERFVILLYNKTSTCTDVNKSRKKLFAKNSSVQRIPPTYAALEQHVKRAAFQRGLPSRVVMSGNKNLSHSHLFQLQVTGVGLREMMGFMNQTGPPYLKQPRPDMS